MFSNLPHYYLFYYFIYSHSSCCASCPPAKAFKQFPWDKVTFLFTSKSVIWISKSAKVNLTFERRDKTLITRIDSFGSFLSLHFVSQHCHQIRSSPAGLSCRMVPPNHDVEVFCSQFMTMCGSYHIKATGIQTENWW